MKALSHTPMWKKILGSFMVTMTIAVMVYVCGSLVATASEEDATLQEVDATLVDSTSSDASTVATTPEATVDEEEATEETITDVVADPTEGDLEITPEIASEPTTSNVNQNDVTDFVAPLTVTITNAPSVMECGQSVQLGLVVARGNEPVDYELIQWKSSDTSSARVSDEGVLTARNKTEDENVTILVRIQSTDEYYEIAEASFSLQVTLDELTAEITNAPTIVGQCTSTQLGVQAYRAGKPVSLLDYKIVSWEVSDNNALQINRNGVLVAVQPTESPATVSAEIQSTVAPFDYATASCEVSVAELVGMISGPDTISMFTPTSFYLSFNSSVEANVNPRWSADPFNAKFETNADNPFEVVCTAKDAGTFEIGCTITFSNRSSIEVRKEITVEPIGFSINAPKTVEANVRTELGINLPQGVSSDSIRKVYWDVSDYEIARITSDGTLVGLTKGTVTVEANVLDTNGTSYPLTAEVEVIHQVTALEQPVNIYVGSNLPSINGRYKLATIYVPNLPLLGSHYAKGMYNEYLNSVVSRVNPANPIPLDTFAGMANFVWGDVTWSGEGYYGEELGLQAVFDDEGNPYWYLNGYLNVEEQEVNASLTYLYVDETGNAFDGSSLSGTPLSAEYGLITGDTMLITAPAVGTAEVASVTVNGIDIKDDVIKNGGYYSVVAVVDDIEACVTYCVSSKDIHSLSVEANFYLTDDTGNLDTASYYGTDVISRTNWKDTRLSMRLDEADEMRQFDCNADPVSYGENMLFTLEAEKPTPEEYSADIYLQPREFDYEVQVYVNDVLTLVSPGIFAPELESLEGKALWGSNVSINAEDQVVLNNQEWDLVGVTPAKIGNPEQVGSNIVRVDYSRYVEPTPGDPIIPVNPTPSTPDIPGTPVDPDNPEEPSGPVTPVDPDNPSVPGDPTDPGTSGSDPGAGSDIPFIPIIGEYVGAYMPGSGPVGAGAAQAIATFTAGALGADTPETISEIADSLVPLSPKIQTDDALTPVYYSVGINLWLSILWGVILASIFIATVFVVRRYNKNNK